MRNSFMSGGRDGLSGVRSFRHSLREASAIKRLLRFQPNGFFTHCQLSDTTIDTLRPIDSINGTLLFCAFEPNQITTWRPIDSINGTFLFCAQDINQFDRTP